MQSLQVEGREISKDFSYEWVIGNADLLSVEKGIPVCEFGTEMQIRDREMEFRILRRLTETQHHNDNLYDFHPDILKLNRYSNIIPYKHSIVKLKCEEEENIKESYINANFINLINGKERMIIATQGPVSQTIIHFWKMITQENVKMIIMLCNLKENSKVQCDQYWPKMQGEPLICGNLTINLTNQEDLGNHLIKRTLKVQEQNEEKEIIQLQWCGWPDQSIPLNTDFEIISKLLNLTLEKVLNEERVVFHCSAGVGRTGTLISLVNLMIILKTYKEHLVDDITKLYQNPDLYKISIFGIVRRLREQRWGMVHTSEQYEYIYKFIDEVIKQMFPQQQ